jgi:hypothetical protein
MLPQIFMSLWPDVKILSSFPRVCQLNFWFTSLQDATHKIVHQPLRLAKL